MRVLMVTPTYYPIKGGMETIVQNLTTGLNRIGIHTDIMTFNMDRIWSPKWKGSTEEVDGTTIFRIPGLNWLPIQHSPRITLQINLIPGRHLYLVRKYDIVHFHGVEFSFPLFSSSIRKPKILHMHGIDIDYFKRYHLSRFFLKNVANCYISISRGIKQDLVELGIPQQHVLYLPNGVETQIFHPKGEKMHNLILFVGRITPIKGLHVLLRSVRYLRAAVRIAIIGPMSCTVGYEQSILELIEDLNRGKKHEITYLGPQEKSEIVKWYQKASILVSPSLIEAFGLVNLEAMACETPVVATNAGGISEVVQNGENGILVMPGNEVKLAEAIQYLLDNEGVRNKFGQNGRRWVLNNFSMEVIITKISRFYRILHEEKESQ